MRLESAKNYDAMSAIGASVIFDEAMTRLRDLCVDDARQKLHLGEEGFAS